MARPRLVVLLPGAVLPAEPAFASLLEARRAGRCGREGSRGLCGGVVRRRGYGLDNEVDGILREADAHGFERFHLVGYSGGGASSLAFAAVHCERLLSLGLLEPAWVGSKLLVGPDHEDAAKAAIVDGLAPFRLP